LELNPRKPSALNNIAVLYQFQGDKCKQEGREDEAEDFFDKAAEYWKQAIRLSPNSYLEAQNWLKTTGRSEMDVFS